MPASLEYARAWRKSHPTAARWAAIKWRYRLTQAQFEEMVRLQDGRCAICRVVPTRWHVDHDRLCCPSSTGYQTCGRCVRSLLCRKCNVALGLANDSTELLTAMIAYLQRHAQRR